MGHSQETLEIRIPMFGSATGLIFENGGYVEVLMTFPEVHKLLDAWKEHEKGKAEPDKQLLETLESLFEKAFDSNVAIVAEVPIAKWRAKIIPIIRGAED
jgi:hypothetical protein